MDEKKLILHAHDSIKQMAKRINPLTGEVVSENDIINNVKISRCLFYVSEILDKYANNLEAKKNPKVKFYARKEDYNNFKFSEEPTYISVLTKKINEFYNKEDMRRLSAKAISDWLVSKGYLELYTKSDDRSSKKPTVIGDKLGIKSVLKEGKDGTYLLNTYNKEAQMFIINNIEEISKSIQ